MILKRLKTLLFILFFASITVPAFADYGTIMMHKAKFVLKNGASITGYIPLSTYSERMEDYQDQPKDKAFQILLNKYFYTQRHTLEFDIYQNYHTLPGSGRVVGTPQEDFYYTDSAAVHRLHLDSIRYTVYLGMEEKPSLMWRKVGIFSLPTVEKLEQQAPRQQRMDTLSASPNYVLSAYFFCFDARVSVTAFQAAIADFSKNITGERRNNPDQYLAEIQAMERLGIAVFIQAEGSC